MAALRLLILAAVLLIAYFAQALFDFGTLAHLYPAWVLERFPALLPTTYWLAEDLYTLALWLLAGSALIFGLLVPPWPAAQPAGRSSTHIPSRTHLMLLGTLLVALILALAWGWGSLPARIEGDVAGFSLQAQALLRGEAPSVWLAPGVTGAPRLAGLPTALLTLVLGSAPAGSQFAGISAAVLIVVATWLLAAELLAGSLYSRQLGLLAAAFTACSLPMLHFGRLAAYLPATAAGTLAAWLLLAGQNRQNNRWLAASGLLVALACWYDRTGLVFAIMLLLWWPALRPRTWTGFATWIGSAVLGLSPLLLHWILDPQAFTAYWHGGQGASVVDWWTNLRVSAATFFWTADASGMFASGSHYINTLVAPLFVLSLGSLLLNVDRILGWALLTWIGTTLLFSSIANPEAPYWPTLLPLLPVVGIAVVYALERIAALWGEVSRPSDGVIPSSASQASSASASLAVGLLVAVAVLTWVAYYSFAATNGNAASYTGRALAALAPDHVAVLVSSTPDLAVRLDDPIVRYVAGERANQALSLRVDAMPARLPPGGLLIIQGNDPNALSAARARYPQATLEIRRDLQANPRLFLLRLP